MIFNRIAVLRAERGMTRQTLAELTEVNYQTIGFIERGDYFPSLELAFKIAGIFGIPVTTVFSETPFEPLFSNEKE